MSYRSRRSARRSCGAAARYRRLWERPSNASTDTSTPRRRRSSTWSLTKQPKCGSACVGYMLVSTSTRIPDRSARARSVRRSSLSCARARESEIGHARTPVQEARDRLSCMRDRSAASIMRTTSSPSSADERGVVPERIARSRIPDHAQTGSSSAPARLLRRPARDLRRPVLPCHQTVALRRRTSSGVRRIRHPALAAGGSRRSRDPAPRACPRPPGPRLVPRAGASRPAKGSIARLKVERRPRIRVPRSAVSPTVAMTPSLGVGQASSTRRVSSTVARRTWFTPATRMSASACAATVIASPTASTGGVSTRSTSHRLARSANASDTKLDNRNPPGSSGAAPTVTTSSTPASGVAPSGCTSTTLSTSPRRAPPATLVRPGRSPSPKRRAMLGLRRSRSRRTTWRPDRARITARFAAVVDLPSSRVVLVTTIEPARCWSWEISRLFLRIRNDSVPEPAGSDRVTSCWACASAAVGPGNLPEQRHPESRSQLVGRAHPGVERLAEEGQYDAESQPDDDPEENVASRLGLHQRSTACRADHHRARAGRLERLQFLQVTLPGGEPKEQRRSAVPGCLDRL